MRHRRKVSCVLCGLSEETTITGALSAKNQVTAHQNCLLFSSGIYCKNTPELDDLFGFGVEDVLQEVKRGRKLTCGRCGRKGATSGCEVRRCKKTYHYPCAILDSAVTVEDEGMGKYTLYCSKHCQPPQSEQSNRSVDKRPSSSSTPAKSRREKKTRASVNSSDSNSSSSATHFPPKRHLSDSDQQEELVSKHKRGSTGQVIDDSPKPDDTELDTGMEMYAPLESDLDDSVNSIHDQVMRENAESHAGGASGIKQQSQYEDETVLYSDHSESLLPTDLCKKPPSSPAARDKSSSPMHREILIKSEQDCSPPDQHNTGPSTEPPPFPDLPPPCFTLETDMAAPLDHPSASSIDSVGFWKSCNSAGCTQAIFTEFLCKMNEISRRIESDQASQEDYDLALKVIAESGDLTQFVAKQQEELQRKRTELKKAAEAMNKVVSVLKEHFKP